MNCINGHSVLDSMKFCSVCGVALAQSTEQAEKSDQNNFGYSHDTTLSPKETKKKSNKFVLGVILFILFGFGAWAGSDKGSSTSETSSSASPSEPITQQETLDQSVFVSYYPLAAELTTTLNEIADYALAGDLQSTAASCNDLKDLSEQGLALSPTGNLNFDQAWGNAMESGIKSAESCIVEDFDSASIYISQMSEYIITATSYIE
jgi:hypothetical protein